MRMRKVKQQALWKSQLSLALENRFPHGELAGSPTLALLASANGVLNYW
ncbi:MAG: hypothetical protein KJZ70_11095 [Bryobacterales bacterium]|nr:hypothetical protein [Bryobacterales bacterium]